MLRYARREKPDVLQQHCGSRRQALAAILNKSFTTQPLTPARARIMRL